MSLHRQQNPAKWQQRLLSAMWSAGLSVSTFEKIPKRLWSNLLCNFPFPNILYSLLECSTKMFSAQLPYESMTLIHLVCLFSNLSWCAWYCPWYRWLFEILLRLFSGDHCGHWVLPTMVSHWPDAVASTRPAWVAGVPVDLYLTFQNKGNLLIYMTKTFLLFKKFFPLILCSTFFSTGKCN